MRLFGRTTLAEVIRALQDELAGGPRAEVPPELQLVAHLVAARDRRDEKRREPEREVLAALPDAAGILGADGRMRLANAALDKLAPHGRALGLAPLEVARSADLAEAMRRALRGERGRVELTLPATRRTYVAHVMPLHERGEVLLVLRDVTEARRLEATRRDFVANASHELRTPVAAIRGAAETLLAGALASPDDARQFVGIVARHAERLGRLTQALLDLSRIEAGEWPLELGRVEAAPLLHQLVELHAPAAAERRIALRAEAGDGVALRADARAVEQVLVNLVDNALKYTPEGGTVTIRATRDGDAAVLSVADTGNGIERHHLPRIFERFYRVDPGRSRDQGGTGLGLAIVKHLVQAQGGDVGVESGSGGSRFWVRLPAA
jgi:two-component system phosphate regulon sensor histidine kinase PhoR